MGMKSLTGMPNPNQAAGPPNRIRTATVPRRLERSRGRTSPARLDVQRLNHRNRGSSPSVAIESPIQVNCRVTPTAPMRSALSERSLPLNGSGSGMSRIARTMFRFAERHEENATVMNVITRPRQ